MWRYLINGEFQSSYTGLVKQISGTWYYVENGRWISSYNGLVMYGTKYYSVRAGIKIGGGKTKAQLTYTELKSAAQTIAKRIASEAKKYSSDKWEQAAYAASAVYSYCSRSNYTTNGNFYREPWGPFVVGEYSCAGSTRALGMVLEYLNISWTHENENQWTHQWCTIKVNGVTGWADGMIGMSGKGAYPFL